MEIKVKIKDQKDLITKYTDLWSKFLDLTKREKELYEILLTRYHEIMDDGLKEPYISQLVFNRDQMKKARTTMGLSYQNFSNIKSSLRRKRIILGEEDNLSMNPMVIAEDELKFKFIK